MSDDLPVCDCGYYRDVCGCPEPPPERAILLDLIAELREPVRERAIRYDEELAALADRAEARLKGINDE